MGFGNPNPNRPLPLFLFFFFSPPPPRGGIPAAAAISRAFISLSPYLFFFPSIRRP